MIAQWENEYISLSVLPVARVMIAQWDTSLSVLLVARSQFPTIVYNLLYGAHHGLPI